MDLRLYGTVWVGSALRAAHLWSWRAPTIHVCTAARRTLAVCRLVPVGMEPGTGRTVQLPWPTDATKIRAREMDQANKPPQSTDALLLLPPHPNQRPGVYLSWALLFTERTGNTLNPSEPMPYNQLHSLHCFVVRGVNIYMTTYLPLGGDGNPSSLFNASSCQKWPAIRCPSFRII
jgi:hypothetical protein